MTDKIFVKPRVEKCPFSPRHPRSVSPDPYLALEGEYVEPDSWWDARDKDGSSTTTRDSHGEVVFFKGEPTAPPKNALSAPAPAGKAEKAGV